MKYLNHSFVILLSIFTIYFPSYSMEQTIVTKRQSIVDSSNDTIRASREKLKPLRDEYLIQKISLKKKQETKKNITLQEIINYNAILQKYNTLIPEMDKVLKNQIIKDIEETTKIIDQAKVKNLPDLLQHCTKKCALSDLIECQKLLTIYISLKNSNTQKKNKAYNKYLKNITQQINQMQLVEKIEKLLPISPTKHNSTEAILQQVPNEEGQTITLQIIENPSQEKPDNKKEEKKIIIAPQLPNKEQENKNLTDAILPEQSTNLHITKELFQEKLDDKKEEVIIMPEQKKEEKISEIVKELPKSSFMNGKLFFITKTMAIIATCALIFYKYDTFFPILEKIQRYYPNFFR